MSFFFRVKSHVTSTSLTTLRTGINPIPACATNIMRSNSALKTLHVAFFCNNISTHDAVKWVRGIFHNVTLRCSLINGFDLLLLIFHSCRSIDIPYDSTLDNCNRLRSPTSPRPCGRRYCGPWLINTIISHNRFISWRAISFLRSSILLAILSRDTPSSASISCMSFIDASSCSRRRETSRSTLGPHQRKNLHSWSWSWSTG